MNPPQKLLFDLLLPTASQQQRSIVLTVDSIVDLIGIVAGLCNAIAWFVVWLFGVGNALSSSGLIVSGVFRHLGLAFIDVSYLWLLLRKSILLHSLHQRTTELVEQIVFIRQSSVPQVPSEVTLEEVSLTSVTIEKLKSQKMLFRAGNVIELGPPAITMVLAGLLGFCCFVLERADSFRRTAANTDLQALLGLRPHTDSSRPVHVH
ncbi:hypothetical protein BV898_06310 [Hypsibius exemplaris]|uniref:Uncharacterized protein n=1 Tax=Hypsibius exemplaris TaxID=2072580 RepID=A0A1W0WX45_HYPEX|nr:hypothetical protein BV898_06310 [Hypsibius exemplaris]